MSPEGLSSVDVSEPLLLGSPQTTSVASKFLRKTKLRTDSMLSATSDPEPSPIREAGKLGSPKKGAGTTTSSNSIESTPTSSPGAKGKQPFREIKASSDKATPESEDSEARVTESLLPEQPNSPVDGDLDSELQRLSSFPLSQEELDEAKTIVLDLLGWGVDPEYLVTSGLSPAVVFRVFNDLHLRLPTNLDVSTETMTLAYSDTQSNPTPTLPVSTSIAV
ncbi:hypothetical protein CPB83DRAFT_849314 [Crepidotus variabilis]|uniref:Uncharacterized protein n=1 Tax=Crepidotus variabilis TaxID=179855 RepID=A0A9P6ELP2_9AGAR|nr:hypothetical protein CPB83DRAFT_849314 [Crepidotus variabilis]